MKENTILMVFADPALPFSICFFLNDFIYLFIEIKKNPGWQVWECSGKKYPRLKMSVSLCPKDNPGCPRQKIPYSNLKGA